MQKVVDFGKKQYAVVQLRKGKWLYTATQKLPAKIDWQKLNVQARNARVEAQ